MAKVTTKKSVKKPVAKKPAAKKTAVKKVTVKKSASKKAAPKKVAAKKTAVKKAAAKKPVAAKVVAKKSAPNKIAAKKTTVKLTPSVKSVKKIAPKSTDIKKTVSNTPAVVKQPKKHNNKNNKLRYSVKDLIFFKKILVEEKQKIIASAKANMKSLVDSESGDYVGDDLSYASHMAEQGTDEMEREKNYMFVQRDEKYLGHIEEALTRIDQGTYGVCIDCIDIPKNYCKTCPLIPKERLEIVPITQHCIECKNIRG